MAETDVGYARLVVTWALDALPLQQIARIDTGTQHRASRALGDVEILAFSSPYTPAATIEGDLRFALRYEGVNLQVLELLFAKVGSEPLMRWLRAQPESTYARRTGFLYEWLTQVTLDVAPLDRRVSYV